jgi:hypothetical protein
LSKGKKKKMNEHPGEHHHSHVPEVVIDNAVIIEVAKLHLEVSDTVWVKVADTVPFAKDWEALHMMQHGLQEVFDNQYPDLGILVIVAPGDAEPVILRHDPDAGEQYAHSDEEGTPFDLEFETPVVSDK